MLTLFDVQALAELLERTPMSKAELVGVRAIIEKITALIPVEDLPQQKAQEQKPLTPNS